MKCSRRTRGKAYETRSSSCSLRIHVFRGFLFFNESASSNKNVSQCEVRIQNFLGVKICSQKKSPKENYNIKREYQHSKYKSAKIIISSFQWWKLWFWYVKRRNIFLLYSFWKYTKDEYEPLYGTILTNA